MDSKFMRGLFWVCAGVSILMAAVFFPSFASLLFAVAAVLSVPLPVIQNFLQSRGLSGRGRAWIAVAAMFAAVFAAPSDAPPLAEADEPPAIEAADVTRSLPAAPSGPESGEAEAAPEPEAEEAPPEESDAEPEAEAAPEESDAEAAAEQARQEEEARQREAEEAARREEEERKAAEAAQRRTAEQAARDAKASNFDTWDIPENQETSDKYVLNTSSKKIHEPDCRTVSKIAPQNYATSNKSVAELENEGYTRCGVCNPH